MCVCERERERERRERERERNTQRERERERECVCVCERERERGLEVLAVNVEKIASFHSSRFEELRRRNNGTCFVNTGTCMVRQQLQSLHMSKGAHKRHENKKNEHSSTVIRNTIYYINENMLYKATIEHTLSANVCQSLGRRGRGPQSRV